MKLINHVLNIRHLIQQALDNRFSRMGLRPDAATPADSLPAALEEKRRRLDDIMSNHLAELGNYREARQATVNECTFTLFNRIAAIKVMEAKELFPEVICRRKENSGRSFAHNVWLEEHPDERNAEREGLKHFLKGQFDILGEHIPLFRADYPYAMLPTADELDEIIGLFNAVDDDPDCGPYTWRGDDILGWLYENFNAVEKAALKKSGAKTEYDKVSLQSQVYTPQWVVKFLVDNTLGKTYLEMYPDSEIRQRYKIANAPTRQTRTPKDMQQLRVLDPACGSGNFLIYAFTLLYDLYTDQAEHYGRDYSRRDIPKFIVENNLYGIDLDERAAQISQIALFIKAREMGGHRSHWPNYTNVVSTHFVLDGYDSVKEAFEVINDLNTTKRGVMERIWNDLRNAYKFGSLVRVEESLEEILPNDDHHSLFPSQEMDDLFSFKHQFTEQLKQKVIELGERGSNAYTLAKTNEAIDFLNIISQQYDVVVANPPYTDSADFGAELKTFVDNNYKKPYKCNTNLYACFIKRCCELADDDGKVGMIHPLTFMYIKSFEDVRKFILEKTHIDLFVEYGLSNLFGSIMVDPAVYVLDKDKHNKADSIFISLDQYTRTPQEKFKRDYCLQALDDIVAGNSNKHVYTLPQSKLRGIKSWPFIYWISDEFREKFGEKTADEYVDIVKGLTTSNNERFLRFWWEIPVDRVSEDYAKDKKKWVRYVKGGPFNKWYGNMWVLLNWENDGYEIKHFVDEKGKLKSRPQNIKYYFREGVTYSASGSKGVSFRYLPHNFVIDAGGPGVYVNAYKNLYYILGFFNSCLVYYICDCLNPTVNINQGDLWRVPFVIPETSLEKLVADTTKQNVAIKKSLCQYSIVETVFQKSPISTAKDASSSIFDFYNYENALLTQILLNETVINKAVFEVYALNEHDKQMVLDKEGIPIGDLPVSPEAKAAYREWLAGNSEFPATEEVIAHLDALEERTDLPRVTDFNALYQNNNGWEEFCIKHKMNPVEVWCQFRSARVLPPQRTQTLAFELLIDVVRTILAKDDDGVIPLGDKMGEERLSLHIEREFMERGYSSAQFAQVCQLLGCDLEKYLRERFFQQLSDHLNLFMYLPKTPFIWHISSGEHHALELYVSIYKWSRDTLFRLRSIYAANRETMISDRLNSLDTTTTAGRMEATELRAMLAELHVFCAKVDRLLASGYDPKLDDGVGKNIAPLQQQGLLSYEVLNERQLEKYLHADW